MPLTHTVCLAARRGCLALAITAAATAWQTGNAATPDITPTTAMATRAPEAVATLYIVQANDLETARAAVLAVGGVVTRELGIINAVGAQLTPAALAALQARDDVRAQPDGAMSTSSTKSLTTLIEAVLTAADPQSGDSYNTWLPPNVAFPHLIDADDVLANGVSGTGVTVAVLDTGFTPVDGIQYDRHFQRRVVAGFDAINNASLATTVSSDSNGHGTHVTSIVMNSDRALDGTQTGVAPDAKLVVVKAFAGDGGATYLNVLTGLNWILKNRAAYGIRVVNLSFSATPRSHYWQDPVNQAVMKLWQAGVVVVAAAGNDGPTPMSIGVPGNTPYIITVGAMTDNYTSDPSDDRLASFSSSGPTYEGFVKPEVVAPGGHIVDVMPDHSALIAQQHPEFQVQQNYFRMSGTSQATAVVTGIVALMLQEKPWLTPDDVKCQLMASAHQAVDAKGKLAYSIFQQGAGMVNASRAVSSTVQACANRGLSIDADIAGRAHFGGLAQQDSAGNYYLSGVGGYAWSGGYMFSNGYLWSRATADSASLWSAGYLWSNSYLWSRSTSFSSASMQSSSYLWSRSLSEPAGVNHWVSQE